MRGGKGGCKKRAAVEKGRQERVVVGKGSGKTGRQGS